MKFLSYVLYCFVIMISFVHAQEQPEKNIINNKRNLQSLEDISRKKIKYSKKVDWNNNLNWNDNNVIINNMYPRLEYKSSILENEIKNVLEELTKIKGDFIEKTKKIRDNDLKKALILSGYATSVSRIIDSSNLILKNLEDRDFSKEKSLLRVSLAILSSKDIPNKIKKLEELTKFDELDSEDKNYINKLINSNSINSIKKVTEDIENPELKYDHN